MVQNLTGRFTSLEDSTPLLISTYLDPTQATGQKRPNVGQLSWPITVPITGMLRQFPGTGNFFSIEKKLLGRQYLILRIPSHESVTLTPELPGLTNYLLSKVFICP